MVNEPSDPEIHEQVRRESPALRHPSILQKSNAFSQDLPRVVLVEEVANVEPAIFDSLLQVGMTRLFSPSRYVLAAISTSY